MLFRSVIDISKLFVLKNLDNVTDAFERRIPLIKDKELVILPTTCGTGSEVTNISIAEIKAKHTSREGLGSSSDSVVRTKLIKALFFDIDGTLVSMDTHVIPASSVYPTARLLRRRP